MIMAERKRGGVCEGNVRGITKGAHGDDVFMTTIPRFLESMKDSQQRVFKGEAQTMRRKGSS